MKAISGDNPEAKASKGAKEWRKVRPNVFMLTRSRAPDSSAADFEVFESKGKIPELYKDAPPGQSIFQCRKTICIFENNEGVRSKSKSKYDSRISKLRQDYEEPKIAEEILGKRIGLGCLCGVIWCRAGSVS